MAKEGSSDYKKVRKRWIFKEPLTEWFFVEPKMVPLWQESATYGTRANSGTQRDDRWHTSNRENCILTYILM